MTTKLLQGLGALFVLALVGTAVAGLMVVKDRVRVVFTSDAVAAGPDPVALLRDDVQVLARDLAALQAALPAQLERLAQALDERASARHAEVTASLQAQQQTLAQALPGQFAELHGRIAALRQPAVEDEPASAVELPPASLAVVVPEPVAPPPAPAKSAGFLSFTLPSTQFRCDEPQDYVLVPELCRVGFDAKSTLHDFSGVTSDVRGSFRADFDDPTGAWTGEIRCAAATLKTGVEGRDEGLREHLATAEHADIVFTIERFVPAAGGVDVAAMTARGEIVGTMTIRGCARPLRMPVTLQVDPQRRVVVQGEAPVKLSDHGVPVPSQLGLIHMQDEVKVWVALRARLQAGARK